MTAAGGRKEEAGGEARLLGHATQLKEAGGGSFVPGALWIKHV